MISLLRALLFRHMTRRATRFLPGGWFALLLLSPRTRMLARSLWVHSRRRAAMRRARR